MSDAVDSIARPASEIPYPARSVAWYAVGVLAFMYWMSILDRFIISLLVDPIKRDLGISDVQFGLLQGLAFALTFSLFGIFLGTLADRFSRRWVIFAGVSVWSIATAACGLAQQFWHLMTARVGVGVGEATLQPCATSMIADLFPRERLTSAMAVYAMGATVGSGCAFLFGGMIVDIVSRSHTIIIPVLGELRSWQVVFFVIGLPGALLSLLIFTLPEPIRRGVRTSVHKKMSVRQSYADLFKFINTRRRFFLCHYTAFTFVSGVISGSGTWYPAHMARTFGWSPSRIGLSLGVVLSVTGIVGQIFSGRAVDAMFRKGYRDAQLRWYAGCTIVATPLGIIATTSSNPWVFLIAIGFFLLLVSSFTACASTALNLVTPNELRGTGMALWGAVGGIIGITAGPILIALASEHLFHGPASLGGGMAVVMGIFLPLAALFLFFGLRPMREAMVEADRWDKIER